MSEYKAWAVSVSAVAIAAVILVIILAWRSYAVNDSAFRHGYEQRAITGQAGLRWVKADSVGCEARK